MELMQYPTLTLETVNAQQILLNHVRGIQLVFKEGLATPMFQTYSECWACSIETLTVEPDLQIT